MLALLKQNNILTVTVFRKQVSIGIFHFCFFQEKQLE